MNPFDKVTLELNRKITSLEEENAALKEQVAQLGIEFTVYKRATDLAYKGSELETQDQLTTLQAKSAALKDQIEYHKGYANEYKETLDEVLANREALKEQVAQLTTWKETAEGLLREGRYQELCQELTTLQSKSAALVDALETTVPYLWNSSAIGADVVAEQTLAVIKGE